MPRIEKALMTGWKFYLGEQLPIKEGAFSEVNLPHDWAISMPFNREMKEGEAQGFLDRWGIGWYKKIFCLDKKKAGYCYYLYFGGIFENSTVWVNGIEVGGRLYGYSSFQLDVTSCVVQGENEILIKVDNTASPTDRWYSGCGIYRTVKWIEVEQKHFNPWDIVVQTKIDGKNATVTIQTGVQIPVKAMLKERTQAKYKEEQIVVAGCSDLAGKIVLSFCEPRLWSAEEPNLYDLELTIYDGNRACDTISIAVGIREVQFISGRGMFVNGNKEILKGVCVHQDVGCRGIAAQKEIWRQRLLSLKEMGCNAVRTAHHVFSTEFLDLCDELGFYVYDECFDKWVFGAYERCFETQWQQDVDAMVKRDRNHPCVVIWGVGNEETNQGQTAMLERLKMLCDYVKRLDSTRPVTYAMKPHFMRDGDVGEDLVIHDYAARIPYVKKIGEVVDVLCCNYMDQWYQAIHEVLPDKLIIGTEVYQYFAGHADQMQNFEQDVPSLVPQKLDYCIGSMIWTGIDYLGESAGYPFKGRCNAMLRSNGDRRPMYYILQSYWTEKPMVHFSVMDYSLPDEGSKWHWSIPPYVDHWHFPQFHKAMIPYMIASNCEEVKLYLNGNEYLVQKPIQCNNRIITGFLPYQPGTVKVVGYKGGREVCCHEMATPGPAVRLEFKEELLEVPAKEGYEILLTVRALDIEKHPVFRENSIVQFRIEGDARIIAVDSGDLMSHEPYQSEIIHMYQGQASVLVRLNGTSGRIVVWADAAGMFSGREIIVAMEETE